ncbi:MULTISPECIES: hypothetical protein [unclassified Fusibacter]|uniref:hypothetical protein n=1 Tax=unclassified Fusibacter TaxID=2624464 RepID=UPI0010101C7F|nr:MULTISPECIES: hypothetical protein [unclassified Fusibacter]MCK8060771.1 hypothetical protein [Fusibacter sp. A2]NPE23067.1 hypothetical protein [Fusibacter sp. A1]RXV59739.1 hypothetical protein DWB64_14595 [Fusibacter sp. A1]
MKINKKVLETIKKKIIEDYKDDVAILVRYNVNITATEENKIGFDFYFIPKNEKAKQLSTQFIIDGISYDLFPMSWDRLISNAAFDSPQAYLLTESEVVYYADQDDLNRFNQLIDSVGRLTSPEYAELMLNKAFEYFNETFIYLFNMDQVGDSMLDLRLEASKVITKITSALAFFNQTYYRGGNGTDLSIIEESYTFNRLPVDYEVLIKEILSASDAQSLKSNTVALVSNTRELLEQGRREHAQIEPFETFFTGYYEELKSILTRFEMACESKVQSKLFLLAAYMHEEVSQFMAKVETGIWFNDRNYYSEYSKAFDDFFKVDLLELIAQENYEELPIAIKDFEAKMMQMLNDNGIDLLIFDDVEAFKTYFESK